MTAADSSTRPGSAVGHLPDRGHHCHASANHERSVDAGRTRRIKAPADLSGCRFRVVASEGGSAATTPPTPRSDAAISRPWPLSRAGASCGSSAAAPTESPTSQRPSSSFTTRQREVGRGSLTPFRRQSAESVKPLTDRAGVPAGPRRCSRPPEPMPRTGPTSEQRQGLRRATPTDHNWRSLHDPRAATRCAPAPYAYRAAGDAAGRSRCTKQPRTRRQVVHVGGRQASHGHPITVRRQSTTSSSNLRPYRWRIGSRVLQGAS